MIPPQLSYGQARERLHSGHVLVHVTSNWRDFGFDTYEPRVIRELDISTDGVGFLYINLNPQSTWAAGYIVAPLETALLYILNVPGASIVDVDHRVAFTTWKGLLMRELNK